MYIAPLRLLEVLIVFFLKLWLVFQIPRPIERALNSSAREDHTATVFVACQTYFVSDWSNRKAIIKLSKSNQNLIQSQRCVVSHYERK